MSREYDDFEESLLTEARRHSSPSGAKARALARVLAASTSASVVIAIGHHLVTLKLWAKSGAGVSTIVAMIGGSAIVAAAIHASASVERVRAEEVPRATPAALSATAAPGSITPSSFVDDATTPRPLPEESMTARSRVVDSAARRSPAEAASIRNAPRIVAGTPAAAPSTRTRSVPAQDAAPVEQVEQVDDAPSDAKKPGGELGQLGRENVLIQTAHSALRRGDTRAAFEALEQHARQFGASGALAPEAEVLRIEALVRVGRRPEAKARARRLITSDPRASLVRRVRMILGRDGDSQ